MNTETLKLSISYLVVKLAAASQTSTVASIGLYLKTPDADPVNLSESRQTVNY